MTTPRAELLRGLEAEVGVLIQRVKRVIGERARLLHPDLHPVTYLLLGHVITHGPVRAAELVDAFGMDKGGVSRQVQALCDLGLVEREADPADRRAMLIAATDLARTRVRELQQARTAVVDQRLSEWSDADLADFVGRLTKYNEALTDR
jgi:DNA-binding MarR family transcriptional regulator